MRVLVFMLFLCSFTVGQVLESGWKGIKPLETSKNTVEELLGKADVTPDGFYIYKTDGARIIVNYSTPACKADDRARGRYNLSKDIVLNFTIEIENPVEISQFKFEKEIFSRGSESRPGHDVIYIAKDQTVVLGLNVKNEKEYVTKIYYYPRLKYAKQLECAPPQGEKIEDGWKGIKPLKTTKAEVEKVLGKSEIDDNGYHRYRTTEAFVRVNYSTAPCKENQYKRGRYNVPENVVLDYYVIPQEMTLLSNITFRREKYYRDTSGDVGGIATYVDSDSNIMISVDIQGDDEFVGRVYFGTAKSDVEKHKCSNDKLSKSLF